MSEPLMAYPPLVMIAHIAAGSVALAAGAGAMAFRKGGRLHRLSGRAFVLSMLGMAVFGVALAAMRPERITAFAGLFAIYLTATAWSSANNRTGPATRLDLAALGLGAVVVLGMLVFGFQAAGNPNGRLDSLPAPVAFVFAAVALLAVLTDLRAIVARGLAGAARIRRHLWRMSTAFFMATSSFFLGQQDEFPAAIQGPVWFAVAFAPLGLMAYWMWRYRAPKRRRPIAPAAPAPA